MLKLYRWLSHIDTRPGFIQQVFNMLRDNANGPDGDKYKNCSVMIDGMSIRDQVVFDGKEHYWGFVDYGAGPVIPADNTKRAKEVVMFLAVGITGHWKAVIAYFLINGISGTAQGELLSHAIQKLFEAGITCRSIVFDGHATNKATMKHFGCSYDPDNLITKFSHPNDDKSNIYFFFDAAHCIKLVRNTLHDYKVFNWPNEGFIKWEYAVKLTEIQEKEGLHAANKITRRHI